MKKHSERWLGYASFLGILAAAVISPRIGCSGEPGEPLPRVGDEIVVCGQLFHTGTPVVTWMDPGGYDAYRVERRFAPLEESDWDQIKDQLSEPNRYNLRRKGLNPPLTPELVERIRAGGWKLDELQQVVDQFVLHYDVCGTSKVCFKVLHDQRGLSVHFMLDVDGTIYQTLDLKERAWHATSSNSRSIGVEIAQIGARSARSKHQLEEWYGSDDEGLLLTIPSRFGADLGIRTPGFVGRPARPEMVVGEIQKKELFQYDYTPEQYAALVKLTATLCKVFPRLKCEFPADDTGRVITDKLPDAQLRDYQGLLGHYHIQENKTDPGPAMDWRRVVEGARELIAE